MDFLLFDDRTHLCSFEHSFTVAAQWRNFTSLPETITNLSRMRQTISLVYALCGEGQCELHVSFIAQNKTRYLARMRLFLAGEQLFAYTKVMDEKYKRQLRAFYETKRRMPSYSEIMTLVGFTSRASVWKLVLRLSKEGFVIKDKRGKLAPGNIWGELRILGLVEAGFPSPAEEDRGDSMSLDEYLIPRRDASYMLKVKGDSMKDAGILEGDMVIVERTSDAKVGNIVIAEVDGAWTMKYLRRKDGALYLEAANAKYKDIHPKGEMRIEAIVRSVVRKY